MKLGTIASPFLYDALACRALRPSVPIAARCPPTVPFAGPCCGATGIGHPAHKKARLRRATSAKVGAKTRARRRNLMRELKSALGACGLVLFATSPAATEDLTIALSYSRTVDRWGQGVTTLFIS